MSHLSNQSILNTKGSPSKGAPGFGGLARRRGTRAHIDLYELDENKEIGDAENVLEFIIITLSRNM